MNHLARGAIHHKQFALAAGERCHAATAACTGGHGRNGPLHFEGGSVVFGLRQVDPALALAALRLSIHHLLTMPGHIDVAQRVRGDRTAAIQTGRRMHKVSLRLEACSVFAEPAIERRNGISGPFHQTFRRSVPCHMYLSAAADRQASAADSPYGDRAAWFTINADGPREPFSACVSPHISDIGGGGIAVEIDKVNSASLVDGRLRLYAPLRSLDDGDFVLLPGPGQNG